MAVTLDEIKAARERIAGGIVRTPLVRAHRLSELLGCELHLKLETFQATGSFKDRGSLNRLLQLDEKSRRLGGGGHVGGQPRPRGRLPRPPPRNPGGHRHATPSPPFSKVERTRRYGAEVILEGDTLDASAHRAKAVAEETGKTFISPYDDEDIIAGQGSIGLELMEDLPDAEAVLVPIGGGGVMGRNGDCLPVPQAGGGVLRRRGRIATLP